MVYPVIDEYTVKLLENSVVELGKRLNKLAHGGQFNIEIKSELERARSSLSRLKQVRMNETVRHTEPSGINKIQT